MEMEIDFSKETINRYVNDFMTEYEPYIKKQKQQENERSQENLKNVEKKENVNKNAIKKYEENCLKPKPSSNI